MIAVDEIMFTLSISQIMFLSNFNILPQYKYNHIKFSYNFHYIRIRNSSKSSSFCNDRFNISSESKNVYRGIKFVFPRARAFLCPLVKGRYILADGPLRVIEATKIRRLMRKQRERERERKRERARKRNAPHLPRRM